MNIFKTFSQPILLAIVWLVGIRPVTYIIQKLNPSTTVPPTVLGTMDIAIISSLIAFLFSLWKPPIEVTTKLTNITTRRLHSNIKMDKKDSKVTLQVWFEISIKVRNGKWVNWSKVTQAIGGVFVGMKENSLVSHEIDSKYDSSLIKDVEGKPFIHLFERYFEISESAELEYVLYFSPDKNGVKTIEMIGDVVPTQKNFFKNFLMRIFISIFMKIKHEKHPVYLD